jgi:murein DD-endopeptidase MepM/ murein hydrolase activator NlpD
MKNKSTFSILFTALVIVFFTGLKSSADPLAGTSPREIPLVMSQFHPRYRCLPCEEFHELNTQIRDGVIDKKTAVARFRFVVRELDEYAAKISFAAHGSSRCVFPLSGYTPSAIGGKRGNGYINGGYDYFAGNAHTGHPAYDIFIRDRNHDALDDLTGKPVNVLAVNGGLVVSVETNWDKGSPLRGGRYIWVYHPQKASLTYYAHNETVFVKVGDMVKPGDPIATVGRTGLNAYRRSSPTHLHWMYLAIKNGLPLPESRYDALSGCVLK